MSYQYVLHTIPHLVEIKPGWLSAQGEPAQQVWATYEDIPAHYKPDFDFLLETGDAWLSVGDQRPSRLRRSGSSDAALHRELDRLLHDVPIRRRHLLGELCPSPERILAGLTLRAAPAGASNALGGRRTRSMRLIRLERLANRTNPQTARSKMRSCNNVVRRNRAASRFRPAAPFRLVSTPSLSPLKKRGTQFKYLRAPMPATLARFELATWRAAP